MKVMQDQHFRKQLHGTTNLLYVWFTTGVGWYIYFTSRDWPEYINILFG